MTDDMFEDTLPPGVRKKQKGGLPNAADADERPLAARPLADRMRPRTLDEFQGQEELVGPGSLLRRMIETDEIRSMIFWGPPGSGKTTLASIIAQLTQSHYLALSGVMAGIADIKRVVEEARHINRIRGQRTILFIDEIHRFNRIQQDALLPHVEAGVVTLIGATTENPSFSVISPLLSRCRVFTLRELSEADLAAILRQSISDPERGLGNLKIKMEDAALDLIARMSDGDARRALNLLEMVVASTALDADGGYTITLDHIKEVAQRKQLIYDATGEQHYNLISAFHKSLRGSDPQAAVYWMVRMLSAGEDPLFVLRRMMNFASEDIGNADPQALVVVAAAFEAFKHMGQPEGEINMAQAVIYLATAPKSNSSLQALMAAKAEVNRTGSLPVPLVIRNAPTGLMKDLGYGEDYRYPHDYKDHYAPQQYLPDGLENATFYIPGEFGFERDIAKRMAWWAARKKELAGKEPAKRTPQPVQPAGSMEEGFPQPVSRSARPATQDASKKESPSPPKEPGPTKGKHASGTAESGPLPKQRKPRKRKGEENRQ